MDFLETYLFLFVDSFAAALILPLRNEMIVHAMIIFKNHNPVLIFVIALLGSTLGSLVNWWIGKSLIFLRNTEFLKLKEKQIAKAEIQWDRYVVWLLLFASIKAVGNPLCLLAGFMKTNLKKFLLLILIGKICYYSYLVLA